MAEQELGGTMNPSLDNPDLGGEPTDIVLPPQGGPPSRLRQLWNNSAWVLFALFCLTIFTLFKLPEERLSAYIQDSMSYALAPQGISMTAAKTSLSMIFGPAYKMKDVTLVLPPPSPPAHIDEVRIYPSVLPLLIGRYGAKVQIINGNGELTAVFSMRNSKGANDVSGWFKAKSMDLGKAGILPAALGVRGSAVLSGNGKISGDISSPTTLNGNLDLELSKIVLDQQSIQGFSVPRLTISDGKLDLSFERSRAIIKNLSLGKPERAEDDIRCSINGDILLGKQWESSTLNAKATFRLSENVLKSMPLIDALLGQGKQADGSYSYSLQGPITAPTYIPAGK
jgi:type II secretion system protein N